MAALFESTRSNLHDPLSRSNHLDSPVALTTSGTDSVAPRLSRSPTLETPTSNGTGSIASLNSFRRQQSGRPQNSGHLPRSSSTTSLPKAKNGLFAFAVAALDRTTSAIAKGNQPIIRPRQSNASFPRLSVGADQQSPKSSEPASPEKTPRIRSPSNHSSSSSATFGNYQLDGVFPSQPSPVKDTLVAQPFSETPVRVQSIENKMHQTSSRLLRMTDDDRPFTKVCPIDFPTFRSLFFAATRCGVLGPLHSTTHVPGPAESSCRGRICLLTIVSR